jgi:4-hydroxybenzoate polyprenyltransferase
MPLLQLIRWQNLLIIFLTQLLVWACVVLPVGPQVLTFLNFADLTLSTILIAAAGYIINDYFDNKIDAINKPERVVLGKNIPRKKAILYHSVLNAVALFLAAYVAIRAHHYEWLLLQAGCTLLLWFYSTRFKRQLIIGNIVVALLTSLTIITLVVYEPRLDGFMSDPVFTKSSSAPDQLNLSWLLVFYSAFAFLLTWMREVVKDMEDIKGDADQDCVTMPIKWGLSTAAHFVQALGVITTLFLIGSGIRLLYSDCALMGYYILLVLTPFLIIWLTRLNKKYTTEHYHKASQQLKIIMILGILSLVVNLISQYL